MLVHGILKLSCGRPAAAAAAAAAGALQRAHTVTCPARRQGAGARAPPGAALKRAETPGKVRLGFVPEEWFLYFHPKTGVTGPYVFGAVVANYLLSKELYVMEHEYYCALSVVPMMYLAATRLGPTLAAALDRDVDAFVDALEARRKDERGAFERVIADSKDAQWRAEGQKLLMDAKKENVAMQLEAAYRERCLRVYRGVTARLEYQARRHRAAARLQRRWMLQWVLRAVRAAVTPDFERAYLLRAIEEVAALASRGPRP